MSVHLKVADSWVISSVLTNKPEGIVASQFRTFVTKVFAGSELLLTETNSDQPLELILYPNPSQDEVNIQLTSGDDEKITSILVLNMQGATIKRIDGLNSRFETIYLKEYGSGVYLIKVVFSNDHYEVKKVLIQ